PIEATVADRDLVGLGRGAAAFLNDPGAEAPGSSQDAERGNGIAKPPEPFLDAGIELLRELAAETDARDIEEGMTIHHADIDLPPVPGDDDICRGRKIERDRKRACKVICCAGRNDAERQSALDDRWR